MQEHYKYFAFISFQSADAKEALWVQKAIESYRLPTVVSRTHSLPQKMRPCFCYLNDINLSEELMQELKLRMEQSEYLIVVCSPRSAKSTFVNGGINYFISLGRRDRIVPLIVEGIPYSNDPDTECFPPALREHFPKHSDPLQDHQILGVNINEEGAGSRRWKRQRAILMVIARMLNLEFENLWNRELKRRRRLQISIAAIILFVCTLLGLTWYLNRSIDIAVSLTEKTALNTSLPVVNDATLLLQLNNETKSIDNLSVGSDAVFKNIPQRFVGQKVKIQFSATDYIPLDTVLSLSTHISLPIRRNEQVYGSVRFRLRGITNPESYKIGIRSYILFPDNEGLVEGFIPLEEQQTYYILTLNGTLLPDTLFMPCGENDIIIVENY